MELACREDLEFAQFQFEKNFYNKKLLVFVSNIQYEDSDNVSEKMKRILILNFGFFSFLIITYVALVLVNYFVIHYLFLFAVIEGRPKKKL